MVTFTPPTHTEYFAPPRWDRLWSRVPYRRGNAVLVTDNVATPAPPGALVVDSDDWVAADVVYHSGNTYTLDFEDQWPLIAAGYSTSIVNDTWIVPWL